jgi:DNA methylase
MAPTQEALYRELDLELSWSERDLPQRERTRHVHGLHPYLGKFVPQLVEILLERYIPRGGHVLDPFAGSGTTLVQALESGYDATGVDIAAFNCLLMDVKTHRYDELLLHRELLAVAERTTALEPANERPAPYLRTWYATRAAAELLAFRALIDEYEHSDVLQVVLTRGARSARRAAHFDLDFPREVQTGPYWCHKHRRMCRPVEQAATFLRRYAIDTLARLEAFARVRPGERMARIVHGDARSLDLGGPFDGVLTSPPYPGLIDYHEQHRYAYELLGLPERQPDELGAPALGRSRESLAAYADGIVAVLENARERLVPGAPVLIVVNDRSDLYPQILERAGLRLERRLRRHVNRRTGRRSGEFYEDVLVTRAG